MIYSSFIDTLWKILYQHWLTQLLIRILNVYKVLHKDVNKSANLTHTWVEVIRHSLNKPQDYIAGSTNLSLLITQVTSFIPIILFTDLDLLRNGTTYSSIYVTVMSRYATAHLRVPWNGDCNLAVIAGVIKLMTSQLSRHYNTRRWNLRVPDPQISGSDFT